MSAYSIEVVNQQLADFPMWESLEGVSIQRIYEFDSYMDGIHFVSKVGEEAEQMDHHPFIEIDYKKVTISLTTHDVGGLTDRDFRAARSFEQAYQSM
ncbi:pterin-4-alpha-carbinolamine dehydratase [Pontibacillus halophilus JSM 076056 = DSM 19796]|uniref:Putative pterin-4-alpha-carbinolamine dehydratase n=1 Tax=Pontibacillus halophilus JSM 076056 = DSM 19796 TaxID=1385510 RepID=A0A0A5GMB6_9BACI|nr:4a-hydroxytetrahydrobiopterin dehydratase [Pontibacillus halophilus]KGX92368.1 pterin-4-alpha-carbinolamine dehydratase [Pontibacillus halophilus JSM 076056 = DSM 19796]